MADTAKVDMDEATPASRGGRAPLLLGLAAMLGLAAAGFHAAYSGLIALPLGGGAEAPSAAGAPAGGADSPPGDVAFVEVPPMVVSLGPSAGARHLRLAAALDVAPGETERIGALMPRIRDVINTYLQALDEADLERPAAMARMRAHLLRRIRIVAGEGAVRDLLITEFVLQ
ncbi:MAG: flagellar basal body-associated FliL family protein [Pseudomonadota bacterium]